MKKCFIGRIKLSKEDSKQWYGNPPYMYVKRDGTTDRSDIRNAVLFRDIDTCKKELINTHKEYRHEPESKMEIMTLSISVDKIEEI